MGLVIPKYIAFFCKFCRLFYSRYFFIFFFLLLLSFQLSQTKAGIMKLQILTIMAAAIFTLWLLCLYHKSYLSSKAIFLFGSISSHPIFPMIFRAPSFHTLLVISSGRGVVLAAIFVVFVDYLLKFSTILIRVMRYRDHFVFMVMKNGLLENLNNIFL